MNPLPPKVRRTLGWQIAVAILFGLMAGSFGYDILTNPKTRARPDFGTFSWFVAAMVYWALAAALSALLIWKRKRAGLFLAWTVLPGILRTAPGLLSEEMREYMDGV